MTDVNKYKGCPLERSALVPDIRYDVHTYTREAKWKHIGVE